MGSRGFGCDKKKERAEGFRLYVPWVFGTHTHTKACARMGINKATRPPRRRPFPVPRGPPHTKVRFIEGTRAAWHCLAGADEAVLEKQIH